MAADGYPSTNGRGGHAEAPALDVVQARFGYGDLIAVWDVSFTARAGALTAIVGRNGAGKTTLMMGISGVLPTLGGSVSLGGRTLGAMSSWDRSLAGLCLVPEGKRVFRQLTVDENLNVGLPRTLSAAERRERCQEVFACFPILEEKRTHLAGSLSGGQQQMLAIGSALAMRPKVLLVDEPSSGLAPTAVDVVYETLDALKAAGMAIVLVEQMVEDVMTGIADEVVVVEQGHVVLRDTPDRISLKDLEHRLYVA
jgi:branched-chain amino acid transport system ATP-binding protein